VIAAAAAVAPLLSLANGGPVAWTEATGTGNVAPRKRADVRLVSEDLVIRLDDDGRRYHVRAQYRLDTRAVEAPVLFGVPMQWPIWDPMAEVGPPQRGAPAELTEDARAAAGRFSVAVAGQRVTCTPVAGTVGFDDTAALESYVADGWCVAHLVLPRSADVLLVLEYTGDLRFQDLSFSKSALVEYDMRRLVYRLDPAGGWAGPAKRLRARLETGAFHGLVAAKGPSGAKRDGTAFVWDLTEADLARVGAIEATVDAEPVLRHRELVRTDLGGKSSIRASSVLPARGAQRYDAHRLLDRDAATAWCEGVSGDGEGSWVELAFTPATYGEPREDPDGLEVGPVNACSLEGFAFVPGYAKSAKAWDENGGVRKLRLAPCNTPDAGIELVLPDAPVWRRDSGFVRDGPQGTGLVRARRFDASAVVLPPPRSSGENPLRCVRLTIVEVAVGKAHDTCISELRPIFNCG
jgi:hypothetical protein